MYSNSSYSFNQTPSGGQYQFSPAPEAGTSYGYPTAPAGVPVQQPGQPMTGGQGMQIPLTGAAPVDFDLIPTTPVMDIDYTQGFLKTQIGRRVKVEFLIGTNMLIDREGTLTDVGISYIIIQEVETDDLVLCDIYSIKFVRFYM